MNIIKRHKVISSIVVLLLVCVGGYFVFSRHSTKYQFVTTTRGPITELVSLTGNTTPSENVSLSFNISGTIANVYSALGKKVDAGQVLAELDTSNLLAQLSNAEAGLTITEQQSVTAKSNLDNVTSQQNTLVANAYSTLLNSTPEAIVVGDYNGYDAPTVTGTYTCTQEGSYDVKTFSSTGGISVQYTGLEQGVFLLTDIPRPMGKCGLFLSMDKTESIQSGVEYTVDIPNESASNYNANNNAYQAAIQTRDTAIANAQASIGATDSSSAISNAQIAQAQASVEIAKSNLQDAQIVAPISGTVTQFDAKIGQIASPGISLVSIISNAGYEVDAGVSETDVSKVAVGNTVTMTLDAFPNETFSGSVFYIAPAETNTNGVITYLVKISFDKIDARLKSGLTANIDIQTKQENNVLILPQYAILQNDQGTYVETLKNNKIVQNPVVLGIQDQKGNVEIISGVTEGEQVINIGLKS